MGGERALWYPDRKHFLLGKLVTDAFLASLGVPVRALRGRRVDGGLDGEEVIA